MARRSAIHQPGIPFSIGRINVGTGFKKRFYHWRLVLLTGKKERRLALMAPCVHIGALSDSHLHSPQNATRGCAHEVRLALRIPGFDPS
jgi:hypothetical protein